MISPRSHWESVYKHKDPTNVSWYQKHPKISLEMIERTGVNKDAEIIDVGGGTSTLIDDLILNGYENVTVLDIADVAVRLTKTRIGNNTTLAKFITADITDVQLPPFYFDVWHDRAVFHFLTNPLDRKKYVEVVLNSVKPGGHVIVATFGPDGPDHCSGLEIIKYSPDALHDEFGKNFDLLHHITEEHATPFRTQQQFIYCYCRKA